jgi:hypothetical protein
VWIKTAASKNEARSWRWWGSSFTTWGVVDHVGKIGRRPPDILDWINKTQNYCMNDPHHVRGRQVYANVFIVVGSCHDSVEADQICDPEARARLLRFIWSFSASVVLHPPASNSVL